MRSIIAAALALGLAAFAASAAGAQPEAPDGLAPYQARQIAPGVHLMATPPDYLGPATGNIVLIEQARGIVIIDSGLTAADGRRAVAYARSIADKPVTDLVYTHWHGDHPHGGAAIRAAWPQVRILATDRTDRSLRTATRRYVGLAPDPRFDAIFRQQIEGLHRQIDEALKDPAHDEATRERYRRMRRESGARIEDFRGTSLALPTETFAHRLILDDPERPIELVHPGRANTDGDAIAWLPRQRILVTGDIVVAPIPFGFFSFPREWIDVLGRLKAMDFAILIPGHGEPQTDSAYLDRLTASIADFRRQIGPLARRGLSLEETRKRTDFSAQKAQFAQTPRQQRQFDAYWLQTMTVNAWREARGLAMVQGQEDLYE